MKPIPVDRKLPFNLEFHYPCDNGGHIEQWRNDDFGLTVTRSQASRVTAIETSMQVDGLEGEFRSVAEANAAIQAHLEQPPRWVAEWPVDGNGSPIEDSP